MINVVDYSTERYWSNENARRREDPFIRTSILVYHWNANEDSTDTAVDWFEEPKGVAGYLKYVVIKDKLRLIYEKLGKAQHPKQATLEWFLNYDISGNSYVKDAQKTLRKCVDILDKAFKKDKNNEVIADIKECTRIYNECFVKSPYEGKIELIFDWDFAKPFMDTSYKEDTRDLIETIRSIGLDG